MIRPVIPHVGSGSPQSEKDSPHTLEEAHINGLLHRGGVKGTCHSSAAQWSASIEMS